MVVMFVVVIMLGVFVSLTAKLGAYTTEEKERERGNRRALNRERMERERAARREK